jgi:hypothetical protein
VEEGSSTELPGGAVNVRPANNACARIGRAGPGMVGLKNSHLGSRPANKPSVTPRAARLVWVGIAYGSPMITPLEIYRPLPVTTGRPAHHVRTGLINWGKCNAFCVGIMPFDGSLCFCERRCKRASCQIATRHRSSPPGCDPELHSGWCADLSRRLRSGWSAD